MRITISHSRSKAEMIATVDRSFDDMLKNPSGMPVQMVVEQRTWDGSTLTFAMKVKMGLLSTPIRGTVEVTEKDITIDADLGMLNKLIPEKTIRDVIGSRVKGLLN